MYYVRVPQKKYIQNIYDKHTQLTKEIHTYVHNDITESMILKLEKAADTICTAVKLP